MTRVPSVVALLAAVACAGAPVPAPVTARDAASPDTARVIVAEFESSHGTRAYRLFVPAGATARSGAPLVVMLHGCAQTAAELARAGRFDSLGAAHGALVVFPEQPAAANPLRCWNWFLPAHQARDAGEPAIIAGLAREVAANHGADPERIYIGGLSAGGAMAVLTGLAYPDLFAAIGTHSGVGWRVARDVPSAFAAMRGAGVEPEAQAREAHAAMGRHARVVPVVAFHGAADTVAHPAATEGLVRQLVALHAILVPGAEAGIDTARMPVGGLRAERRRFTGEGGVFLEHWVVAGLGHALSGGDPAARWTDARGPDAAKEMLGFFLERRLTDDAARER